MNRWKVSNLDSGGLVPVCDAANLFPIQLDGYESIRVIGCIFTALTIRSFTIGVGICWTEGFALSIGNIFWSDGNQGRGRPPTLLSRNRE
ncbi:MAG: hypothetical protein DCC52_11145 [Chloroflexi bacterium]|nr:MAG: hypothetical protein DCC52_11145 [Chloroflexota bacterium]